MVDKRLRVWIVIAISFLLVGCTGSFTSTVNPAQNDIVPTVTEIAVAQPDQTVFSIEMYEPPDPSICQFLQQEASRTLGVDFDLNEASPFNDPVSKESGLGCHINAIVSSTQFESPQQVMSNLVGSIGLGWNEQLAYQADGVMGTATGFSRDMALMLIQLDWAPAQEVVGTPADGLDVSSTTDLKYVYTIKIDVAQYKATFSLDGHWVDQTSGFTLDLYQDWKNIYGQHLMVAENGNKIDSLEDSINGMLNGQVATVAFRSSFSEQPGTAEITYVDVNTIHWKIITPPTGEFYLPDEAILNR